MVATLDEIYEEQLLYPLSTFNIDGNLVVSKKKKKKTDQKKENLYFYQQKFSF